MAELAAIVREKTGTNARLVHKPLPIDDPRQRRPDISRARKALGWAPLVALSEGLDRTIAHFAAELGRPLPSRTEKAV
jgi:UDP-glucuronate decarboxylase